MSISFFFFFLKSISQIKKLSSGCLWSPGEAGELWPLLWHCSNPSIPAQRRLQHRTTVWVEIQGNIRSRNIIKQWGFQTVVSISWCGFLDPGPLSPSRTDLRSWLYPIQAEGMSCTIFYWLHAKERQTQPTHRSLTSAAKARLPPPPRSLPCPCTLSIFFKEVKNSGSQC